jgi:hypothetical protein
MLSGKLIRAGAGKKYMPAFFHHRAGEENRIPHRADSSNRAGTKCRPFHERGVHFDFTILIKTGANAGVKDGIIL